MKMTLISIQYQGYNIWGYNFTPPHALKGVHRATFAFIISLLCKYGLHLSNESHIIMWYIHMFKKWTSFNEMDVT